MREKTIAAIATPPGDGGIAIIRISGEEAIAIANQILSYDVSLQKSHTLKLGSVLGKSGLIDQALVSVMHAPNSFTGEDVVEIQCHGGSFVSQKVLEAVIQAGASIAAPGEFSMRAYLNRKIDLAKAEAIGTLIHAQNELALSAASDQLQGKLSQKIQNFQKELTQIAAIIEAWVDYPEEGLEFASVMDILSKLEAIQKELCALELSFRDGRIASYGINLCILGAPNVGKSSLMNALAGYNKAIVTPIAGTTRDVLEEKIRIGNLHFNLIDTAGIRETSEEIEQEGIRRSFEKAEKADLILLVLDASRPMEAREIELSKTLPLEKTLIVWNKKDIATAQEGLLISAKDGTGLDELKEAIEKLIWNKGAPAKDQIMLTQERHYKAVKETINALNLVIHGLETDLSAEFISFDLRQALKSLSSIIGTNVTEDILNEIFSKFCVGK
jgi:tRNA modification GTPase